MGQDHRVREPVRDAGTPADELREPVVHAHRRVLERSSGERRAGERIGPRIDIVRVVDHRRQRACEAADSRERDRFGFGRAVRGVHDLDAVSERVHPGLGAHPRGRARVSNGS